MEQVALIGARLRLPGADGIDAFWRNIIEGRDCISTLSDAALREAGVDAALSSRAEYVRRAGVLDDIDRFDYRFFGYTFREAQAIDPQQRVLLSLAHQLLEQVGAATREVGVFASVGFAHYLLNNLSGHPPGSLALADVVFGNSGDCAATRIAYKLDLHGPAMSIQSGCSSSLLALHNARVAILTGQCRMALVGAAAIHTPQHAGYLYQRDGVLAKDGVCRPFDAAASGTVFTNGAVVLALKALSDARRDGDPILAVIRGSAVNNDGARKSGYTAPSVAGQADAIRRAYQRSGIDPATIGYLETHGTGTTLGDPIEFRALRDAYGETSGEGRQAYCALGSVKANIGHTDVAAGLAGVLKAALCLTHRIRAPLAGFTAPNPELTLAGSPFYVPTRAEPWPDTPGTPRRAAVSALGVGGSNAHVIIEQAPEPEPAGRVDNGPLLLSARTPQALDTIERASREALDAGTLPPGDARYTSQLFRRHHAERRALVFGAAAPARLTADADWRHAGVVLLFPGQGTQYAGMGRELHARGGRFRDLFDACAARFVAAGCHDPRAQLNAQEAALRDTAVLQPYLFTLEYALGMLLIEMGLPVVAAAGHSLGEYVAATLAGVFELDDAVRIVGARARIMSRAPRGAMLAVLCDEARVAGFVGPEVSLCTVNSETSCVLGGTEAAIDALAGRLAEAGLASVRLPTSHAFHSHLMAASSLEFAAAFDAVTLHPPRFPIAANLDGRADRPERFATRDYWIDHLRGTVRFRDCLATLAGQVPFGAWIEAGPGKSLVNALARALPAEAASFSTLLPGAEAVTVDTLLGQCWVNGMEIDWLPLYGESRGKVVPLPPHPLDEVRCWIDAPAARRAADAAPAAYRKQDDLDAWLYEHEWAEAAPARHAAADHAARADEAPLLLIGDGGEFASRLARRLARHARLSVLDDFVADQPAAGFEARLAAFAAAAPQAPGGGEARPGQPPRRVWRVLVALPPPVDGQRDPIAAMLLLQGRLGALRAVLPGRLDVTLVALTPASGEPCAAHAWIDGFATVAQQEFTRLRCRTLQVEPAALDGESGTAAGAAAARDRLAEACLDETGRFLRVDAGRLLERRLRRGASAAPQAARAPRSVLVVGGAGNVGMVYAAFFASVAGADVAIVSRGATRVAAALNDPGAASDPALRRRHGLYGRMVQAGHRIRFIDADATDPVALEHAAREAEQAFGSLDLIVHAAGAPTDMHYRAFNDTDHAYLHALIAPKLAVCANLHALTRRLAVSRVMVVSSISATLGGIGLYGYAASHSLLNAYARSASSASCAWSVIDWDAWAFFKDTREDGNADIGIDHYAISEEEGLAVLGRLAALGWPAHVVVASGDLLGRYRNWVLGERDDAAPAAVELAPRPPLKDELVPPRNEVERVLAALWSECVGVQPVGIRDNFFELGGHSLIALKLVEGINQALDWDLAAIDMFRFPTIERLAEAQAPRSPPEPEPARTGAAPAPARRRHDYYQSRKLSMESQSE
ncbi:type I polyketide synthase [Burkholderia glumae]|uniref:type I polyketide synthase n=1 Tax=Burkholderia glumae TaxID=337 RepID=UPI0012981C61|nr:type I polyketide synthase [Burkholderia glumae]MCM2547868.1 SDR family NAD(P)-dependent oxidoreductase [Burkholderia glumae]NVE21491.1 SDR family NAD(P)-dependent oxidoreductase [Burkholderia glumae]QGA37702.1 SDR family NAD(P)-dependent oxidoreductase [Burkholderia glumae]